MDVVNAATLDVLTKVSHPISYCTVIVVCAYRKGAVIGTAQYIDLVKKNKKIYFWLNLSGFLLFCTITAVTAVKDTPPLTVRETLVFTRH